MSAERIPRTGGDDENVGLVVRRGFAYNAWVPLVLASASPRRKELLERVGVPVEVDPAAIDEAVRPDEPPLPYVTRMAVAKTAAVAARRPEAWVLGADTIVEVDGAILGKAADDAEALAMLRRLVGRTHRVSTAVCVRGPGGAGEERLVSTEVVMRDAGADELAAYVRSGEWRGKAGAYAVQGMAAALVTEVRGSITNVVGLPLAEVLALLGELGAPGHDYGRGRPA
jgi:septum formation protein